MNCTSEYPPKLEDININFINYMKKILVKLLLVTQITQMI